MTTPGRAKHRARRIAADEAHAWARNLRLNNAAAKLTLSMLSLYVDGEGFCFVSIPTLSDDTELSTGTVRSRLAWLEQIGAITRQHQWVDEYGRRNGEGKGRRTSDLIRLMIDVEPDDIEASAIGVSREVDPPSGGGSNPRAETADPTATLQRPSNCVQGLISEPEPEPESPPTPFGGESEPNSVDQVEPEHFGPAWLVWPGHEVMRRDLALAEFRLLTAEQQQLCRAAIPQFVRMQQQLGRKHPPNFHLWIRNKGFDEFPTAKLEPAPAGTSSSYDAAGREARALKALYGLGRVSLFEHRGRVVYPLPVTAQVLAFADLPPRPAWCWIDEGERGQLAAWSAFLAAHVHVARPPLVISRVEGEATRRGFWAPWPWPPRKDGSISPAGEGLEGDS